MSTFYTTLCERFFVLNIYTHSRSFFRLLGLIFAPETTLKKALNILDIRGFLRILSEQNLCPKNPHFEVHWVYQKMMGFSPFAYGLCVGSGLPPLGFLSCAVFGFWGLLFRLKNTPQKWQIGSRIGWQFGFGYHVITLYWIAFAMHVDWETLWPLFFLALFGIPCVLSLLTGLGFGVLVHFVHARWRCFFVPLMWLCVELAQARFLTGFPWNPLGLAYADYITALQAASLFGVHGLSFLLLSAIVLLFRHSFNSSMSWFVAGSFFMAPFVFGMIRLMLTPTLLNDQIHLALIQPNIPQRIKFQSDFVAHHFSTLLEQTREATTHTPGKMLVIWPESATAYDLTTYARLQAVSALQPEQYLITGLARHHEAHIYNSLGVFNAKGVLVSLYDKAHLVPFGEYLPMRYLLPKKMRKITHGPRDFSPGPGCQTLYIGEKPFPKIGPLICYEVIFSGAVAERTSRPDLLINITNDGWYLNTSGPYQHFEHARLRAIEEALPLVRVANTGISGVFDPLGRMVSGSYLRSSTASTPSVLGSVFPCLEAHILPYGEQGTLITALPQPLSRYVLPQPLALGLLVLGVYLFFCCFLRKLW